MSFFKPSHKNDKPDFYQRPAPLETKEEFISRFVSFNKGLRDGVRLRLMALSKWDYAKRDAMVIIRNGQPGECLIIDELDDLKGIPRENELPLFAIGRWKYDEVTDAKYYL